jgi:uncharacterized membrane protein
MNFRNAEMASFAAPRRGLALILGAVVVAAVVYVLRFVGPYLSLDPVYYDYFWPWRYALWAHLAGGVTALLIGPIQLWLGLTGRRLDLHRRLGTVYLWAVGLSLSGASYLIAKEIRTDWVFASGLLGLACAWTVTTGFGYLAIRRNHRQQHREWMIRSYVVASAFVFFRIFVDLLHAAGVHGPTGSGTSEELKMAAWLCWAVPLLLTEPLIQWRHLRRNKMGAQRSLQMTEVEGLSRP